jgi:hypothetical protein
MSPIRRIGILVVIIGIILSGRPFSAAAQTDDIGQKAVRAQLKRIPNGKSIEVTLLQEGSRKMRGKLISVGEDSFDMRTKISGGISTETVAFASVKSVKKRGMSAATKVSIIAGAAVALAIPLYKARSGKSGG